MQSTLLSAKFSILSQLLYEPIVRKHTWSLILNKFQRFLKAHFMLSYHVSNHKACASGHSSITVRIIIIRNYQWTNIVWLDSIACLIKSTPSSKWRRIFSYAISLIFITLYVKSYTFIIQEGCTSGKKGSKVLVAIKIWVQFMYWRVSLLRATSISPRKRQGNIWLIFFIYYLIYFFTFL